MIKQIVRKHDLAPREGSTNFDDYYDETGSHRSSNHLSPDLQRLKGIIEERKKQKSEDEMLRVGDNERIISLDSY